MQSLSDLMKKISSLLDYKGDDEIVTSLDMQDIIRKQPDLKTFNSKIPSLDMAINGFEPGEVVAISGPTKGGKTLLGQTLTINFEQQNVNSLWFSYELTPR